MATKKLFEGDPITTVGLTQRIAIGDAGIEGSNYITFGNLIRQIGACIVDRYNSQTGNFSAVIPDSSLLERVDIITDSGSPTCTISIDSVVLIPDAVGLNSIVHAFYSSGTVDITVTGGGVNVIVCYKKNYF